jgi:hypothetical protein
MGPSIMAALALRNRATNMAARSAAAAIWFSGRIFDGSVPVQLGAIDELEQAAGRQRRAQHIGGDAEIG